MSLPSKPWTLQDLYEELGKIPLSRVLATPGPGVATETDLIDCTRRYNRLYELINRVLVEKPTGNPESLLVSVLSEPIRTFLHNHDLGIVNATVGWIRLLPGLVRTPDIAYSSWDRIRRSNDSRKPISSIVPDSVAEVVHQQNTKIELRMKRDEYFASGVRVIWEVDPKPRTITVYTPDGGFTVLEASQSLEGDDVLPGFHLDLSELFSVLNQDV